MSSDGDHLLITCEHGGRRVPPRYRALFARYEALLNSHRGWDFGALVLARELATAFDAPLLAVTTTRLLVDLNRSVGHPNLHSEATRSLSMAERREIISRYYRPHRDRVETEVLDAIARGQRVLHIASHSFTPELDGEVRDADISLLYDPTRSAEVTFATRWLRALKALRPDLRVRRNYPYAGKGDGLTRLLRRHHPVPTYVGIELEMNQKHFLEGGGQWSLLRATVIAALREALAATG